MRNPDEFDAFYKATRERVLLQTFALTGDLPASRRAVRDAFVAAWHHRRKLDRQPDSEAWVRRHAWADAQRRHTARIWHRDKSVDHEARATLDSLAKLNHQQRRVLVLNHLTSADLPEVAREVGVTLGAAERALQAATSRYAVRSGAGSPQIHAELIGLSSVTSGSPFPRAPIIRRAGAVRRRVFTSVGIGAAVAGLVGSGMFVTDQKGVSPNLSDEDLVGTTTKPGPEPARLDEAELLTRDQASRLDPTSTWEERRTGPNTYGDGLYNKCQTSRFADPDGTQSLVRSFRTETRQGRTGMSAVQATELSPNRRQAKEAYATTLGWYAACAAPQTQLLATFDVPDVGDRASAFLLRTFGKKPSTLAVAVARTRRVTITVARSAEGSELTQVAPVASLLGLAVNRLCGSPGGGSCAAPPRLVGIPPLATGEAPGLLQAVDLPQAGSVAATWTGTEPRKAHENLATIACDTSDFSRDPVSNGVTRSFLMVEGKLPKSFGITETAGTVSTRGAAAAFVGAVRDRMAGCEDEDPASTVTELADRSENAVEIAEWHIVTEVNDSESVDFLMAIVRRGKAVAQIGFVTAERASFDRRTFLRLGERTVERLAYLPK